jgi:magnesium chelatase family protein
LLAEVAAPDRAGENLLQEAATKFGLSARGYHRVLRLARTLADLDGVDRVVSMHIAEALAYRRDVTGGTGGELASSPALAWSSTA